MVPYGKGLSELSKFQTICHFYIWYFFRTRLNKDANWTVKLKCTSYGKHFLGVFVSHKSDAYSTQIFPQDVQEVSVSLVVVYLLNIQIRNHQHTPRNHDKAIWALYWSGILINSGVISNRPSHMVWPLMAFITHKKTGINCEPLHIKFWW